MPWEQSEVKKQERCVWRSLVSVILWKGVERCNTNLVHSYCATHDELTAGKRPFEILVMYFVGYGVFACTCV